MPVVIFSIDLNKKIKEGFSNRSGQKTNCKALVFVGKMKWNEMTNAIEVRWQKLRAHLEPIPILFSYIISDNMLVVLLPNN